VDGPEDALTEALNVEIARSQRRFVDLQARLIGYEIASPRSSEPSIKAAHCPSPWRSPRLMPPLIPLRPNISRVQDRLPCCASCQAGWSHQKHLTMTNRASHEWRRGRRRSGRRAWRGGYCWRSVDALGD
jgi:hypothetical protein